MKHTNLNEFVGLQAYTCPKMFSMYILSGCNNWSPFCVRKVMHKMKNLKIALIVIITASFVFASCGAARKCDGRRGTRTEMGTM